jgi:hypothetical protein
MESYFPAYMPQIPYPCFSLRSRRETNTIDTANVRLVEYQQNDVPTNKPSVRGVDPYQDMNPIPSRLYREDMRQSQPFVIPVLNPRQIEEEAYIEKSIQAALKRIQELNASGVRSEELKVQEELYRVLLLRRKQTGIDALTKNPYFEKYDVEGDTRNIIRELRSSVYEDITDRGTAESQKFLRRGMENRWMPAGFAKAERLDRLNASYELVMRPTFNRQEKTYF